MIDFQITLNQNNCHVSFLKNGDFINIDPIEFKQNNNIVNSNLTDLIQIKSENSGIIFDPLVLCELSPLIAASLFKQSQQNANLKITNNQLKVFIYSLTQLPENNLKIFSLWKFESNLTTHSRADLCFQNYLEEKKCCIRNFLI